MTYPIQLISTDFDGTLHADFEDPPVPHDLQDLIGAMQAAGVKWVINTGRDLSSVMEGMARARLNIRPDYLVVVERHIYRREGTQYRPMEDWNMGCEVAHSLLFEQVRRDIPKLVHWINQRFQATLYEDEYSPFCLIADNNENAGLIQQFLEAYCESVPELTCVRNDVYARFSHSGYSKGSALQEIARQLQVAVDQIFAAGDHLNDLPMLHPEVARCVAAPHNAVPEVKEAVRRQQGYISHQPWGHGVARALEYYIEKEKS